MGTPLLQINKLPERARLLFYSHDSYGLGHLSRTIAIAYAFLEKQPNAEIKILTGSPSFKIFSTPRGCSLISLSAITKNNEGLYIPCQSEKTLQQVHLERSQRIRQEASSFQPHLFLVDHVACGAGEELLHTLQFLRQKQPNCRIVLGIRDIIDSPDKVRKQFARDRWHALLRTYYDRVLIYGCPKIFDVIRMYRIPYDIATKIIYTGYLGRNVRQKASPLSGSVLVTVGGGEDGTSVLEAYLRDLQAAPKKRPKDSLLITGPNLPLKEYIRIKRLGKNLSKVRILRSLRDLSTTMSKVETVICRGGYNTLCEGMSIGCRMIVIPRKKYREEQSLRAELFAKQGLVEAVLRDPPAPGEILRKVLTAQLPALTGCHQAFEAIPIDGLTTTANILSNLVEKHQVLVN